MQHSSQVLFCGECGLANEALVGHCAACGQPLTRSDEITQSWPIVPVVVTPPPVTEVTPGPLLMPFAQDASGQLVQYPACDFRPGSIFAGRYQILEEIGRGGFSTVYRAIDQAFGYHYLEVAIKRIQLDQLSTRQVIDATETFNREVAMLAQLRGTDGIPVYYAHLTDAENWYLITQYIRGVTLEEYMQRAPGGYLSEQEVITVGATLAELFQSLHNLKNPVIFRDLKPSNIMITPARAFYLIDFGIARTFTPGKSKDTTPLGSPGFAPPEQYGKAQTDQRSDIYSLGATLQTLLTGRDPLELRSGQPALNPQPPSRVLRTLLDTMLAAEAVRRPATMKQVAQRLKYLLHSPRRILASGFIFGGIWGITFVALVFLPSGMQHYFASDIFLFLAFLVERKLYRKWMKVPTKTPAGFLRFWWLGFSLALLCWLPYIALQWLPSFLH